MRRSTLIPTDNWQLTLATRTTLATFFLCFALLVPNARAAERVPPSQPLTLLQLEMAVRAKPGRAASTVTHFLQSGPTGSVAFAGQSVAAAMRGLGPLAGQAVVGRVMLAVAKARPDAVLEIVRVAIPLTKKDTHQEIVAASVSGITAVADVSVPISVKSAEEGAVAYERSQSTSKGAVQVVAGMSFVEGATLAEDIVQVAFQSGSHENMAALSQAANGALTRQSTEDPLANLGQLPFRPSLATPAPVSP